MPIPVLKLNLAPPPTLWRQKHELLGWGALFLGALCLIGTLSFWGLRAYQARKSAQATIALSRDAAAAARKQENLVNQLRDVDVAKELPRWKLAERIFTERTLPWSRLTAELERSLVRDVRLKAIQKVRGSDQRVSLKLKGEARTREAEEEFVASLQKDDLFQQVVLEREAERTGGGVDFEMNLPVVDSPSPYQPFPSLQAAARGEKAAQSQGTKPSKASPIGAAQAPAPRPLRVIEQESSGAPVQPARTTQPDAQGQPTNPRPMSRPTRGMPARPQPRPAPDPEVNDPDSGRPGGQGNRPSTTGGMPPGGQP